MRVQDRITIECDVPAGVEDVAADEIRERLPRASRIGFGDGKVWFEVAQADLACVPALRTIAGAWIVESFEGRKPTVVTSGRRLAERVRSVVRLHRPITAFTLSAPGAGSPAMRRVRTSLAADTGLRETADGLLVRMRRRRGGWDVLVAASPRPLAERRWRVERSSGAVNGPLAAALVRMTEPRADDRFLNVACGSATIAIERALACPAACVVGVDIVPGALASARANVRAARSAVGLVVGDGRGLPFARGAFDVVVADLPWGYEVGSHDVNVAEYRALVSEMGRVSTRRARACVLTAETRLMQRVLGELAGLWRLDRLLRVEQGGARPGLFLLRRA